MTNVVMHKTPLTFDEQVEVLIRRGLQVDDPAAAGQFLASVNYYHLRGYYLDLLPPGHTTFRRGATFAQIQGRYVSDQQLKTLLFAALGRIEQRIRTITSNSLGICYGALGYGDAANFQNPKHHADFMRNLDKEKKRSREEFVEHHRRNYNDELPSWVMVELLTLGYLSKLVKNTKPAVHKLISGQLQTPDSVLDGMLRAVTVLRNLIAHHVRLRAARIHPTCPVLKAHRQRLDEAHKDAGEQSCDVQPDSVFATILAVHHLQPEWEQQDFARELQQWFITGVDVGGPAYGFPKHWQVAITGR